MNSLQLFLPCAAGVEDLLAQEVHRLTGLVGDDLMSARGGVFARASWRDAPSFGSPEKTRIEVESTPPFWP